MTWCKLIQTYAQRNKPIDPQRSRYPSESDGFPLSPCHPETRVQRFCRDEITASLHQRKTHAYPGQQVFPVKLCIQITRTNQYAGSDLLFFCAQVLIGLIKLLHQCATLNLWLEPILRVRFHLTRKEPRNTGSHQWTRWPSSPSHPRQLRHPKPRLSCK